MYVLRKFTRIHRSRSAMGSGDGDEDEGTCALVYLV